MEVIEIPRSPADSIFREKVRQLLDGAHEKVGIIAGEFGAYRYPDLREGVQHAIRRGVAVRAYGNEPSPEILGQMTEDGVGMTVGGLRSLHHYFVADDRNAIVSFKTPGGGPTTPGSRWGKMYLDDPEMATAVTSYQRFLQEGAKGAPAMRLLEELTLDIGAHPLLARRIRIADNVLAVAGVEAIAPSSIVEALLASLHPANARTPGLVGDTEDELALVNQMALLSAMIFLSHAPDFTESVTVGQLRASKTSVDSALRSLKSRVGSPTPRESIWQTSS